MQAKWRYWMSAPPTHTHTPRTSVAWQLADKRNWGPWKTERNGCLLPPSHLWLSEVSDGGSANGGGEGVGCSPVVDCGWLHVWKKIAVRPWELLTGHRGEPRATESRGP